MTAARAWKGALALAALCTGSPAHAQGIDPDIFAYDRNAALDVVEHRRVAREGATLLGLDYASPDGGRVPAYLYVPDEPARRPAPAVLMLHGVPGGRGSFDALAQAYARAGVYVLSISAPGVRSMPYRSLRIIPLPMFNEYDRKELVQLIRDLRRAVDYLETQPFVDTGRVAFLGHSAGAMAGALLAAADRRVAAFVLMAPTPGWVSWLRSLDERSPRIRAAGRDAFDSRTRAEQDTWIAQMEPLEATRWVARAAGTPLLFQGGTDDRSVPRLDVEVLFEAAADPKRLEWYDAGHFLGARAFEEGARFLARHLEFDTARFVAPDRFR